MQGKSVAVLTEQLCYKQALALIKVCMKIYTNRTLHLHATCEPCHTRKTQIYYAYYTNTYYTDFLRPALHVSAFLTYHRCDHYRWQKQRWQKWRSQKMWDVSVNYLLAAMINDHKPVNTSRKVYYEST